MGQYYTVTEEYGEKFFRVPKVFMTNPKYKKMKPIAKLAWAILRDRHDLSVKNKWIDENGRIYFIFGRNKLAEILDCDPKTATSIRDELQKYELLDIQDMGKGFTDRLYLLKPEVTMADVYKIQNEEEQAENPPESSNSKGSEGWGKNSPTHQGKNSPTTEGKLPPPLGEKFPPNDTDISDTEKNDTDNKRNQNQNLSNQLFTMDLPMPLKKYFSKKVSVLVNDSFDIDIVEEFYNTSEHIKPDCSKEDPHGVNKHEYTKIVKWIFENVKRPIGNTHGLIKDYVLRYLSFKMDAIPNDGEADENFWDNAYERML